MDIETVNVKDFVYTSFDEHALEDYVIADGYQDEKYFDNFIEELQRKT